MNAPSAKPPRVRRAAHGLVAGVAVALLVRDLRLLEALAAGSERVLPVAVITVTCALLAALGLRVLVLAALGLVGALWLAVVVTPLDLALARGLPRADPLAPADLIYVLSSSIQPDGDLTPESTARMLHGLELVGQGLAPRLVVGEPGGEHGSYATTARGLILHLGLHAEVLAVGPVTSTRDEAVLVGRLARERGWRRVLLVTSPVHSRRAAGAFAHEGLEVVSAPTREARYDLERLATGEDRLLAFGPLLHERLGLWDYGRRGWLAPDE